jgi:hypothetical protein
MIKHAPFPFLTGMDFTNTSRPSLRQPIRGEDVALPDPTFAPIALSSLGVDRAL